VENTWNPALYQSKHSFVWEYGRDLLALLDPQPGERVLDVGCGTGQLTSEIAYAGAEVTGIDNSPSMIEKARDNFPAIRFDVQDVRALPYNAEFDAVFSNAVLHWVIDAEQAVVAIGRALKPGGRFVAELGGRGNIRAVMAASDRALRKLGVPDPERDHPWYYPSVSEYSTLLERNGFEVNSAALFDRPTPLEGDDDALPNWLRMFGARLVQRLAPERVPEYHRLASEFAAPALHRDEGWFADYRRLRIVARREQA